MLLPFLVSNADGLLFTRSDGCKAKFIHSFLQLIERAFDRGRTLTDGNLVVTFRC